MPPIHSAIEADGLDSGSTTPGHNWVEIRSAGSMGNGLFATKDIPRGTRIIAERPILKIAQSSSKGDVGDLPAFCTALQQLPKVEWKHLDQLYCNTSHITPTTRAKTRQWYRDQGISDSNGEVLKGKKLQDIAKAATKRFAIFLTNRVQMGSGGAYGNGVFSLYSRINHSCVPNVHNTYNPNIECLTIHSIRNISASEQITASYISSLCRPRQQRKLEIDIWGFVCSCLACIDPSIDPLRQRAFELDQGLAVFDSPFGRMPGLNELPLVRMLTPRIPTSVIEALQNAEELVNLLKKQGIEGMELCKTYRDCSKHSLELGDIPRALDYARKELDIERCIIGTETAHLRNNMDGAEYWLAHLGRDVEKETPEK
ncbi:hypothetical protein F5X99DRAFT_424715 [Biscogniauxia marginata]|nr:hypothetical protein F5X99DRAFT_424715 [Biscogniauxia marginata]